MPTVYRRNIVVGPKTWGKLRALAKAEERSMSDLIREAILELFKRRDAGISHKEEYNPVTDTFGKRDN